MKKILGWCTIFQELESVAKAKFAQNNSQVSEGGIIEPRPQGFSLKKWVLPVV